MCMKKRFGVYRRCMAMLAAVVLVLAICPVALADTDEKTMQLAQEPDQLILQLGTRWAGVEFELRTDAGTFPVPVVVDESGILTMDLGGSTTYTLSCLNSDVTIPDPVPGPSPEAGAGAPPLEPVSPAPQPDAAPVQNQGIPALPLILFLSGLALAAGGLTALFFAKRDQQADYDDWEDEL